MLKRKGSSAFYAQLQSIAKEDSGDKAGYIRTTVTDITEHKKAKEKIEQTASLQNAIFNSANFSSIATDAKGVIQIFNVGAGDILVTLCPECLFS